MTSGSLTTAMAGSLQLGNSFHARPRRSARSSSSCSVTSPGLPGKRAAPVSRRAPGTDHWPCAPRYGIRSRNSLSVARTGLLYPCHHTQVLTQPGWGENSKANPATLSLLLTRRCQQSISVLLYTKFTMSNVHKPLRCDMDVNSQSKCDRPRFAPVNMTPLPSSSNTTSQLNLPAWPTV